jgi:hypothetical protein
MFYTVASQNARDEGLQADADCKSVDNFGIHGQGLVLEATDKNPRIRRLLWYMQLLTSGRLVPWPERRQAAPSPEYHLVSSTLTIISESGSMSTWQ